MKKNGVCISSALSIFLTASACLSAAEASILDDLFEEETPSTAAASSHRKRTVPAGWIEGKWHHSAGYDWSIPDDPKDLNRFPDAVKLCRPSLVVFQLPPAMRGLPLEVVFHVKGHADLFGYSGGNVCRMVSYRKVQAPRPYDPKDGTPPLYCSIQKRAPFPEYEQVRMIFPAPPKETVQVAFALAQCAPGRPYIDSKARNFATYGNVLLKGLQGDIFTLDLKKAEGADWTPSAGEGGVRTIHAKQNASLTLDPALYKGKSLAVQFRVKGSGNVTVSADDGLPGGLKPLGRQTTSLGSVRMPFRVLFAELSPSAKKLDFQIKTDGNAEISDLQLLWSDRPLTVLPSNFHQMPGGFLPKGYVESRTMPNEKGLPDLTEIAEEIQPFSFKVRRNTLSDGALGTTCDAITDFRFPRAVKVSGIRLTLPPSNMYLYADTNGDGEFDRVLFEEMNAPVMNFTWGDLQEYVWFCRDFKEPVTVHALRYAGGGNEFRILGTPDEADLVRKQSEVNDSVPLLTGGDSVEVADPPEKDILYYGFTLEPWMFGMQRIMIKFYKDLSKARQPDMNKAMEDALVDDPSLLSGESNPESKVKVDDMSVWPEWQNLLADFKTLRANFILLFPPHTCVIPPGAKPAKDAYPAPVMWPSKVWYLNQPNDFLSMMNRDCKKHGIKNFVVPRSYIFNQEKTEIPKRVIFAEELAERKSDGVTVGVDEEMIGTGCIIKKEEEKKEFQELYGLEPPSEAADTKACRLAYLYHLNKLAAQMADIKARTEKLSPDSLTVSGWAGCDHYKERYQMVSGHDAWGFEGRLDVMGGDGTYFGVGQGDRLGTSTPYLETAVQVSCTPTRMSMGTINFNWGTKWEKGRMINPLVYDDFPDMSHYAGALATYFAGGQFMNFWRYNYMDMKGPATRKAVQLGGEMTRTLSSWGGRHASVPKDVLLLRSRTSEDWWSMHIKYATEKNEKTVAEQERGFTNFFWTGIRLIADSVPFEIYAMHRPEVWKDIAKQYKVILLPFAYAVSDEEAEILRAASAAGVKIVLLEGGYPAGSVDALGEPRAKNAFEGMDVIRFRIDSVSEPNTEKLCADFRRILSDALGSGGASSTLKHDPRHDVHLYMLSVSDREKLLFCANWSELRTPVEIGVRLPAGKYRMQIHDTEGLREGLIGGKKEFTEKELAGFRLDMIREDARLIRIYPAE